MSNVHSIRGYLLDRVKSRIDFYGDELAGMDGVLSGASLCVMAAIKELRKHYPSDTEFQEAAAYVGLWELQNTIESFTNTGQDDE